MTTGTPVITTPVTSHGFCAASVCKAHAAGSAGAFGVSVVIVPTPQTGRPRLRKGRSASHSQVGGWRSPAPTRVWDPQTPGSFQLHTWPPGFAHTCGAPTAPLAAGRRGCFSWGAWAGVRSQGIGTGRRSPPRWSSQLNDRQGRAPGGLAGCVPLETLAGRGADRWRAVMGTRRPRR